MSEKELIELVKKFPNDLELGKKIREILNEIKEKNEK
jgi:hypothetical protein